MKSFPSLWGFFLSIFGILDVCLESIELSSGKGNVYIPAQFSLELIWILRFKSDLK